MRTTTPSGYCGCAPRPPARGGQSRAAPAPCGKMAPAGRGCGCSGSLGATVVRLLLLLLGALACARATEHYSPLSLLKQELQHRQQQEAPAGGGCPQSGDWADQYPECGEWAEPPSPCGRPCPAWKHLGGGGTGDGLRRAAGTWTRLEDACSRARARKSDFFLPAPVGDLLSPYPRNPILRDASRLDLRDAFSTDSAPQVHP